MNATRKRKSKNKKTDKSDALRPSLLQRIRSKMAPVYRVYAGFCEETTLHGLKHTVAADLHWFERLIIVLFDCINK